MKLRLVLKQEKRLEKLREKWHRKEKRREVTKKLTSSKTKQLSATEIRKETSKTQNIFKLLQN